MHLKGRPLLWPLFFFASILDLIPSLFAISLSFLSLFLLSISLSRLLPLASTRVAFRNLFVIKAAIYFTLIEKIGRLPLAATIYHDRTRSSASLLTSSPPQKIIMPRMYVPTRCNCGTFSRLRDFPPPESRMQMTKFLWKRVSYPKNISVKSWKCNHCEKDNFLN